MTFTCDASDADVLDQGPKKATRRKQQANIKAR